MNLACTAHIHRVGDEPLALQDVKYVIYQHDRLVYRFSDSPIVSEMVLDNASFNLISGRVVAVDERFGVALKSQASNGAGLYVARTTHDSA